MKAIQISSAAAAVMAEATIRSPRNVDGSPRVVGHRRAVPRQVLKLPPACAMLLVPAVAMLAARAFLAYQGREWRGAFSTQCVCACVCAYVCVCVCVGGGVNRS